MAPMNAMMTDEERLHLTPIVLKYGLRRETIVAVWRAVKFSQRCDITIDVFAYASRKFLATKKRGSTPAILTTMLFEHWGVEFVPSTLTGT